MRVCIVTGEFWGLGISGGIGTAFSHLSLMLSKEGIKKDLFYTGVHNGKSFDHIKNKFDFEDVYSYEGKRNIGPTWLCDSYYVFRQLSEKHKTHQYTHIIFQDWLGLSYYSLIMKKMGLCFDNVELTINVHGPTKWAMGLNEASLDENHGKMSYLEEESLKLADSVIYPSRYIKNWVNENITEPKKEFIIPNFLSKVDINSDVLGYYNDDLFDNEIQLSETSNINEFVFFGRLEQRKGVDKFVEFIRFNEKNHSHGSMIYTFLGREAQLTEKSIRESLGEVSCELQFIKDFNSNQAQEYLKSGNKLAVIASKAENYPCTVYECVLNSIPFVSSVYGGGKEIFECENKDKILFDDSQLSFFETLNYYRDNPYSHPKLSFSLKELSEKWVSFFENNVCKVDEDYLNIQEPLISVIITHYERPHLLCDTFKSILEQDYSNYEIIIVDDGSKSIEATEYLKSIELLEFPIDTKVVYQKNSYLGAARNTGVKHAKGDYIVFIDDDDIADEKMLSYFFKAINRTNADIVSTATKYFYDNEGYPKTSCDAGHLFIGSNLDIGKGENCFGPCTSIIKKDVFSSGIKFHEHHGIGYEDWHFYIQSALKDKTILSIPTPLLNYRVTSNSMIRTNNLDKNMAVIQSLINSSL